jgi:hypothetical protein
VHQVRELAAVARHFHDDRYLRFNSKVRERALFCRAQSGDDRAIDLIESILTK